jgi:hypothetical protein
MKSTSNREGEGFEENAFLVDSVAIVVKLGTSCSNAKIADLTTAE